MTEHASYEESVERIDEAVQYWQQGDCVLGEHWFAFLFHAKEALTEESRLLSDGEAEGVELAEAEVPGFALVTQTCDIVRSCAKRPFVEVAPLQKVESSHMEDIQKGWRPQYAYISGVAELGLVVDLDRVMTVEKSLLALWERVPGCRGDDETRSFAFALARKRSRFAFPDDFNRFAGKLQSRLKKKHNKASREGQTLRDLKEIRVRATPSWEAERVALFFWFVKEEKATVEAEDWSSSLGAWLELLPEQGFRFSFEGTIVSLHDMTAQDYLESDRLDLDHLSGR